MGRMWCCKRCKIASLHLRFLFLENMDTDEGGGGTAILKKKFHDAEYEKNKTFFELIHTRAVLFTIAIYQTISCICMIFHLNSELLKGPTHAHSLSHTPEHPAL